MLHKIYKKNMNISYTFYAILKQKMCWNLQSFYRVTKSLWMRAITEFVIYKEKVDILQIFN